nr:hypothetical protein [bacterium]
MSGSINTITRGKKKYVVYKNCYRVKTNKKNSGKTRNTGKSEVITENKYLGTLENVLAKLSDKTKPAEFELERFGLEAAAIEVIERLEIRELLRKHFPASFSGVDTADYLLAAIIHRLHEAEPKSKIEDFINKSILKRHYGLDASKFNSQNYWKAYDSIISEKAISVKRDKITELKKKELTEETQKQIEKLEAEFGQNKNIDDFQKDFLNALMNKEKLHSEFLYIDSTNFYNYIDNNNGKTLLCARGKNKDGRNFLNQITLSIAATAEYEIPLVNEIYKGNYNDISLFPTFITKVIGQYAAVYKNADELFVSYDKGNNSEDNYNEMEAAAQKNNIKVSVVGSLRQDWHKELMDIPLKKFKDKKSDYAYYSNEKKVFGKKQKIVVTYHKSSAIRQEIKLNQKIEELTKKIKFYFDELTEEYKTNLTDEKLQNYI